MYVEDTWIQNAPTELLRSIGFSASPQGFEALQGCVLERLRGVVVARP